MRREGEEVKEREVPTHLIKVQNLPMLHTLLKIVKTTRYVAYHDILAKEK